MSAKSWLFLQNIFWSNFVYLIILDATAPGILVPPRGKRGGLAKSRNWQNQRGTTEQRGLQIPRLRFDSIKLIYMLFHPAPYIFILAPPRRKMLCLFFSCNDNDEFWISSLLRISWWRRRKRWRRWWWHLSRAIIYPISVLFAIMGDGKRITNLNTKYCTAMWRNTALTCEKILHCHVKKYCTTTRRNTTWQ